MGAALDRIRSEKLKELSRMTGALFLCAVLILLISMGLFAGNIFDIHAVKSIFVPQRIEDALAKEQQKLQQADHNFATERELRLFEDNLNYVNVLSEVKGSVTTLIVWILASFYALIALVLLGVCSLLSKFLKVLRTENII